MRRPLSKKAPTQPDYLYHSVEVSKFINYVMLEGKKNIARDAVYSAFDEIKKDSGDPLEVFNEAVKNVGPQVEVRSRRIGGANYQVPREVRPERRLALAFRWILEAARTKKGKPIARAIADELIAGSKNEGEAVKKRENTHRMAEANKAFAHFSW